jgi:type I site-specific restriction-modification system R (restriction) subunit
MAIRMPAVFGDYIDIYDISRAVDDESSYRRQQQKAHVTVQPEGRQRPRLITLSRFTQQNIMA